MKSSIFFFLLIALFVSDRVQAQSEAPRHRNLVVEVQGMDTDKRLPALQQHLQQGGDAIRVEAFCADQGWLLLRITEDVVISNEQVEQTLKPFGLSFLIKAGATRKEFNAACSGGLIQF